jgi:hypothetical protein
MTLAIATSAPSVIRESTKIFRIFAVASFESGRVRVRLERRVRSASRFWMPN